MPFFELAPGHSGSVGQNGQDRIPFRVFDAYSLAAAKLCVEANTASFDPISGYVRLDIQLEEIEGGGVYTGEVVYGIASGQQQEMDIGDADYQFEIGMQTEHITNGFAVRSYPSEAPDFKGAIGVSQDRVDGIDIDFPVFSWNERHIFALSMLYNTAYQDALYYVCSRPVNNAIFRRKPAGEVRILGVVGARRDAEKAEFNFRFMASPNFDDLSAGDVANITKKGWEYLWTLYEEEEDADVLVKVPAYVYVHQVYRESNYGLLQIGVT